MAERIKDNIWSFPIPLPDNPLKWLNCYVLKSGGNGRDLLIDTGFNRPECIEALLDGMRELELAPENTDVFISHLHSDHTGGAPTLQRLGCRIMMSGLDHRLLNTRDGKSHAARIAREGMPLSEIRQTFTRNPAVIYAPGPFDAEEIEAGRILRYGGRRLSCIPTPGHSPGHMCLYDRDDRLMFLGDHVLFDITPNIIAWPELPDSLGVYLESLERTAELEVETALPAHRSAGSVSLRERAAELLAHHGRRLAETEAIIGSEPGLNAYQIAGRMTWHIRADSWEDFPLGQKWFAMGETLTHLDYLVKRGRAERRELGGSLCYY